MRRPLIAAAGWTAFAAVCYIQTLAARAPIAPPELSASTLALADPTAAAPTPGDPETFVVIARATTSRLAGGAIVVTPAPPPRHRITLETLAAANAWSALQPGEDMALTIQHAASRAGRQQWYRADWSCDGILTPADVATYAAAFEAGAPAADLNHDGRLDELDLGEFLRDYREAEARTL
ncbi:MAG: GC-type dockerin domain-anchored protein [Phycisphaerales bacterium]